MKLQITDAAVREMMRLREAQDEDHQVLVLSVRGGGCSGLMYDMKFGAMPEDWYISDVQIRSFVPEGSVSGGLVIAVDAKSAKHLDGTTIDFREGLMARGFEFANPNARTTCGCGQSFG